jgi:hypothetical protein
LVDDLNAEIGEGEEDDESNFEHLKEDGGDGRARSRNVAEKKSAKTSDHEEEEVKETKSTFNYEVIEALLDFFAQDKLEPISCGYFNKVM